MIRENNPPIFLMITERGEDMLTPFLRDYSYESLYYTLL